MNSFSLNHVSETEFEEFCYDLLGELGFVNLQWRKGTGLESSPSDHGRDIQCQIERTDIDGHKYLERWFVECKHHVRGVPPSQIQGALAWATAECPATLLIIASNFLSNPTKDFLENYERKNSPRFKVKVWERPDLEKLTLGKSRLLRKYRVVGEFPFLSILHPAHVLYMKGLKLNSMDHFFEVVDGIDSKKRDDILGWMYYPLLRPRHREPTSSKETLKDLLIDEVSYGAFKSKCYEIVEADIIDDYLLVFLIVNFVLQSQLGISDTTSVDELVYRMRDAEEYFKSQLKERPGDKDLLERMIERVEETARNAHERTERHYQLYEYFCDEVIHTLLLEDIFSRTGSTQEA
jgi:hypothetical protein